MTQLYLIQQITPFYQKYYSLRLALMIATSPQFAPVSVIYSLALLVLPSSLYHEMLESRTFSRFYSCSISFHLGNVMYFHDFTHNLLPSRALTLLLISRFSYPTICLTFGLLTVISDLICTKTSTHSVKDTIVYSIQAKNLAEFSLSLPVTYT